MRRLLVAVVVLPLLLGAAPAPVVPSITLNQPAPALGDWVDFTTVIPKGVRAPRVQVMCYQDGVLVYAMADAASASLELGGGSSAWRTNGGPASCTADLFEWKWLWTRHTQYVVFASTEFEAGG